MNEELVKEAYSKADDAITALGQALDALKGERVSPDVMDKFQEKIVLAAANVMSYKTLRDLSLKK